MVETPNAEAGASGTDWKPVPLLEQIKSEGRVWEDLCAQYGATHPDPPWKTSLDGMCEALAAGNCSSLVPLEKGWLEGSIERKDIKDAAPLPLLERRWEEDELSETLYQDVPFPERQLLALVHSMIKRGLVEEGELAKRMAYVRERNSAA